MKNQIKLFALLAFISLYFSSCEEKTIEPTDANIVGAYSFTSLAYSPSSKDTKAFADLLSQCAKNNSYTFKEGGDFVMKGKGCGEDVETITGYYELFENQLIIENNDFLQGDFTASLKGKKLTLEAEDSGLKMTIVLTKK